MLIKANGCALDLADLVGFLLRALQDAHELVLGHRGARWGDDVLSRRCAVSLSVLLMGDISCAGYFLGGGLVLTLVSAISAVSLAI